MLFRVINAGCVVTYFKLFFLKIMRKMSKISLFFFFFCGWVDKINGSKLVCYRSIVMWTLFEISKILVNPCGNNPYSILILYLVRKYLITLLDKSLKLKQNISRIGTLVCTFLMISVLSLLDTMVIIFAEQCNTLQREYADIR